MNRRALGRGRRLIALGALIIVAGMLPAWWTLSRTNAVAVSGNGLDGIGIVVFLAALAMLAVLTLPYATRDGDAGPDRPATYILLSGTALAAFLVRVFEISGFDGLGLPTDAPGLWLTGVGLLVAVWGVGDILVERPTTY